MERMAVVKALRPVRAAMPYAIEAPQRSRPVTLVAREPDVRDITPVWLTRSRTSFDSSTKTTPHHTEREASYLLNLSFNVVWIIAAVVLPFLAPMPPARAEDPVPAIRARLINQINAHRRTYGLAPLTADPIAQRAAQYQAQDMESSGVMRHEDSNGRTPMRRYAAFGGHAALYGENVAFYGDSLGETDAAWQAVSKLDDMMMAERPPSDGHRENILSPDYKAIGIGVAVGVNGLYIAEDFVSPQ